MHAKQMQALDVIPRIAADFAALLRARAPAGWCAATAPRTPRRSCVALGSVLGTIEDVVDELRDEGVAIGAVAHEVLPAVPAGGGPRGARGARSAWSSLEKAFAVGVGGIVGQNVRLALSGIAPHGVHDVVAGLGGRPITTASLRRLFDGRGRRPARPPLTLPRPRPRARRARAAARRRRARRPGPHAENILRDIGTVAAGRTSHGEAMACQEIKFYQTGSFAVGNRLLDPEQRTRAGRARTARTRSTSGHRACQGCGEALGARYALDAAMRATRGPADRGQRDRLPRGLLDALPRDRRGSCPWIHSLFGNAPAVATGIAAALKAQGPRRTCGSSAQGGDGGTVDIGFGLPVGHVRAQRRRAVRLLRQRGLHEHRGAALGGDAARRAHGDHQGGGPRAGQRLRPGQERCR